MAHADESGAANRPKYLNRLKGDQLKRVEGGPKAFRSIPFGTANDGSGRDLDKPINLNPIGHRLPLAVGVRWMMRM